MPTLHLGFPCVPAIDKGRLMTLGTEFWSAISGAVVGGMIALGIQLITLRASKRERYEVKQERKEALGQSILFKLVRIQSNLYDLHLHLEESFATANPQLLNEPWRFVLPLANFPADVHFSPEEISLVLSFKEPELTDSLMSLDAIHNSLIAIIVKYAGIRNDFQTSMPAEMDGNVGSSYLTKEELQVVRPRMVIMNQIITNARERAKMDYQESRKTSDYVLKSLNDNLGLELKIEFKPEKLAKLAEINNLNQH